METMAEGMGWMAVIYIAFILLLAFGAWRAIMGRDD